MFVNYICVLVYFFERYNIEYMKYKYMDFLYI